MKIRERERLLREEIRHKILLVNVNRSYPKMGNFYLAAKEAWRVNENRAKEVDYVCAVYQNIICKTFRPTKWYRFPENGYRWGFDGDSVNHSIYDNKDVGHLVKNWVGGNPVRFF